LLIEFIGLNDEVAKKCIMNKLMQIETSKYESVSVSLDHDPRQKIPSADFRVLLLFEPQAVMPWQYRRDNYSKFNLVVPMSFWRAKELGIENHFFKSYANEGLRFPELDNQRKKKIVMINSAKFSSGCTSLYSLRRETSKRLHSIGEDYTLYGENWRMPKILELRKRLVSLRNSIVARESICINEFASLMLYRYPEYYGWIENKFELLSQAQLSLIIENDRHDITEKIFDSMYAGAVPIYVGPEFSREFPQLERCIIRASTNVDSIVEKVQGTTYEEVQRCRLAIKKFLGDESEAGIGFWRPEYQWNKVSEIIYKTLTTA
jgi:hypothetical protein